MSKEQRKKINLKFHGKQFFVAVNDGNGLNWLFNSESPIGPITAFREHSRDQKVEIERALENALLACRRWKG